MILSSRSFQVAENLNFDFHGTVRWYISNIQLVQFFTMVFLHDEPSFAGSNRIVILVLSCRRLHDPSRDNSIIERKAHLGNNFFFLKWKLVQDLQGSGLCILKLLKPGNSAERLVDICLYFGGNKGQSSLSMGANGDFVRWS